MEQSSLLSKPQRFEWFWQSDPDPFAEEDPAKWKWTKYSDEISSAIEEAFQKHVPTADIGDYEIDFKEMFQFNKRDRYRQRRVKREVKKEQISESRFLLPLPKPASVPQQAQKTINDAFGNVQHFLDFLRKRTPEGVILHQRLKGLDLNCKQKFHKIVVGEVNNCIQKAAKVRADELTIQNMTDKADEVRKQAEEIIKAINDNSNTFRDFLTVILKVYTMETFVCYWLNELLRNEKWEEMNVLTPYLVCLVFVFQLNNYVIKIDSWLDSLAMFFQRKKLWLYRGTALSMEQLAQYDPKKTKMFSWNSVISTSRSKEKAMEFVEMAKKKAKEQGEDKVGVIFMIEAQIDSAEDCEGMIDVSQNSKYPDELEVIVAPGTAFTLVQRQQIKDQHYQVDLKVKKIISKSQRGVLGTLQQKVILEDGNAVLENLTEDEVLKILMLLEGNKLIKTLEIRNCTIAPEIIDTVEFIRKTTLVKEEEVSWKDNYFEFKDQEQLIKLFPRLLQICVENNFVLNGVPFKIMKKEKDETTSRFKFYQEKEFYFFLKRCEFYLDCR